VVQEMSQSSPSYANRRESSHSYSTIPGTVVRRSQWYAGTGTLVWVRTGHKSHSKYRSTAQFYGTGTVVQCSPRLALTNYSVVYRQESRNL
jgi:hypothetical protein